jgi:hypothetical protein
VLQQFPEKMIDRQNMRLYCSDLHATPQTNRLQPEAVARASEVDIVQGMATGMTRLRLLQQQKMAH